MRTRDFVFLVKDMRPPLPPPLPVSIHRISWQNPEGTPMFRFFWNRRVNDNVATNAWSMAPWASAVL